MKEIAEAQLSRGEAVHIGGKNIYAAGPEADFEAFPFIDLSAAEDKKAYENF